MNKIEHLKSVEPNDDGTFNIITKEGNVYTNCYPQFVNQSEISSEKVTVDAVINYSTLTANGQVIGKIKDWKPSC